MEKFLIYALALVPGIGIAIYIYFMDKDEPEPVQLVIFSFLLGLLSLGLNSLISLSMDNLSDFSGNKVSATVMYTFGIKAFVQEFCKFIVIRGILYRNKNFNEPLDGIVYSVMVAMGFTTGINLIDAYSGSHGIVVLPILTTVLSQASFAVLMGYMLGKAKFTIQNKTGYMIAALAVPVLFHILFDYLQFVSSVSGLWIGLALALAIILYLGKEAFEIQQKASPFKKS